MMAGMSPEEARNFHEEDEDPQKIFALFEAGQKRHTMRPGDHKPDPRPMHEVLGELAQLLRQFRLRDRIATGLRHLATAVESHNKVQ
jgi:hypothetical protein